MSFSHEVDLILELRGKNKMKLAQYLKFKFHYIVDVISLNTFGDYVGRTCHTDLEITSTTDTTGSVSYYDMHIESDSVSRLRTISYDKKGIFNSIQFVNVLFIGSHIPAATAYRKYISQLTRYFRVCSSYIRFLR